MSSPPSTNNKTSSSAYRVNYSEYVADITSSPKSTRQSTTTGIGHHINPLHNPYPNRQNQPIQQTGAMPVYGGGAEKCARCLKSVYLAEKKVGAGRSFHISCFSCHTCKRKLDATTLSEHKAEIYCKSCYTRQFGAHGLISGVTMSTEHSTRDSRPLRRSSYGDDLDTPVITHQQTKPRASSNDRVFRDDHSTTHNDGISQNFQRRYDASPEQHSSTTKKDTRVNAIIDTNYQRSSSTSGLERIVEQNMNNNRHRSTYVEEDDRRKYIHEGERLSYGSGASAVVHIPIAIHPQRSDSTNERLSYGSGASGVVNIPIATHPQRSDSTNERLSYGSGASGVVNIPIATHPQRSDSTNEVFRVPIEPIRHDDRSRSPSVTSNDSYRRQGSHDRQTDFTDNYSHSSRNEDNNNRKHSNENAVFTMGSENPITAHTYQHSSSYEVKQKSTTSNANNYGHEQYHSRDSSPSVSVNRNRPYSPISGHTSSSIAAHTSSSTHTGGALRDPISSSTYRPNHDYLNTQTSTNSNVIHRHSSSPTQNERTPSVLTDFVHKTNLAGHVTPPSGGKNSTLGALIKPRQHQDDDYLD